MIMLRCVGFLSIVGALTIYISFLFEVFVFCNDSWVGTLPKKWKNFKILIAQIDEYLLAFLVL